MRLQRNDGSATVKGSTTSEEATHHPLHVCGRLVDASKLAREERRVAAAVVLPGRGDEASQTTRTPFLQGSSLSFLANEASTSLQEGGVRGASGITSRGEERSEATSHTTALHGLKAHTGDKTRSSRRLEGSQLTPST
jgi:hypothetical protein